MAEEIVKFLERCPPALYTLIEDGWNHSEWESFVSGPLRDTKDRDSRLLGGGRPPPETLSQLQQNGKPVDDDSSDEEEEDLPRAFGGQPLSRAASNADGFSSAFMGGPSDNNTRVRIARVRKSLHLKVMGNTDVCLYFWVIFTGCTISDARQLFGQFEFIR